MELKVSRPIQIVAVVGILTAVIGFFGFSMLGGGGGGSTAGHRLIRHPHGLANGAAKPRAPGKTVRLAPPSTKHVKKAKPAHAKPKPPRRVVAPNGLPVALASALARNPVVVAVLYDPEAKIDAASYGEAKAGAALAGVPFVPVNVLRRAEVEAISEKFGVISNPAVLIFRTPTDLFVQLNGFADKETVAQAVANAQAGSELSASAPPRSS